MSTPQEHDKAAEEERRRHLAAIAATAAAAAAAASAPPSASAASNGAGLATAAAVHVATAPARAAAAAAIVAAFVAFTSRSAERDDTFLKTQLTVKWPKEDIADTLAAEHARGVTFAEKATARLQRDLPTILAIPDPARREKALQGLMGREQWNARQRSEAILARGVAAVERQVLRRDSPQGAFWKLSPLVAEHTAGCLIMGGKFWPWAVLDRVHPPRHGGCPCRLVGYGQAIAEGLMRPGDIPNVKDAIASAAGVVMEAAAADELTAIHRDFELREALIEAEIASPDDLADIAPLG